MTALERLLAIEDIKQVKASYFYGLDHKDWSLWRNAVFAHDARMEIPEIQAEIVGLDNIVAWVAERTTDQESIHHGHMPIIQLTSDDTATGIWAMEDRLYRPKGHALGNGRIYLHGFGHYRESYIHTPAGWRISTTRLTRLRVESRSIV